MTDRTAPPSTPLDQPKPLPPALVNFLRAVGTADGVERPVVANIRDAAISYAIAALGDSALTHDGWLRPRVWELADQIAAYIADGSRP